METVISLLVLGAIYLVSYVMKSLSASQSEEGGSPVFGDGFPTIEILQPETNERSEVSRPAKISTVNAPEVGAVRRKDRVAARLAQTDSMVKTDEKEVPVKRGRLVALNSKTEAKRAFIYSEIFNRKY